MKAQALAQKTEASRAGFFQILSNGRVIGWKVTCSQCGISYKANWGPGTPSAKLIKDLRRKDWTVDYGVKPLCPACVRIDREQEMNKNVVTMPVKEGAEQTSQSPLGLRLMREVFSALEGYFDDKTGRYIDGWSDERIAKETGAALEFVKKVRRESYGEIEDPALIAARKELMDIKDAMREHEARVGKLETLLEGIKSSR